MLFSHSRTARRVGLFALLVAASFASLTGWLDPAAAFPPPPSGPPANPAIAFASLGSVKVMNADGSNLTSIYTQPRGSRLSGPPSWSPDGGSIAFVQNYTELWRVDVAVVNGVPRGSNASQIVTSAAYVDAPAWSPMGNEIAYYNFATETIEVVPATGGTSTVLFDAADGEYLGAPAWSPDGTRLAFPHRDAAGMYLKVLDRATLEVTTVLTLGLEWDIHSYKLDWSRTTDMIAFTLAPTPSYPPIPRTIQGLDLATGTVTELIGLIAMWGSWSPDDSRMVFVDNCDRVSGRCIWVADLATGNRTQLARYGTPPDWRR